MSIFNLNTNLVAENSKGKLFKTQNMLSLSMERLSSGKRVNSSKDDAAGMSIIQSMKAKHNGNAQAIRNANDAMSLVQTAEGATNQISDSIQRINTLAIQMANSTYTDDSRANAVQELNQLTAEISRTIKNTEFNGQNLLNTTDALTFQIGADNNADSQLTMTLADLSSPPPVTPTVVVTPGVVSSPATYNAGATLVVDTADPSKTQAIELLVTGAGTFTDSLGGNTVTFNVDDAAYEAAVSATHQAMLTGTTLNNFNALPTAEAKYEAAALALYNIKNSTIHGSYADMFTADIDYAKKLGDIKVSSVGAIASTATPAPAASTGGLHAYNQPGGTPAYDISTQAGAQQAIAKSQQDLQTLSKFSATFGAMNVRFEAVVSNLTTYNENLSAAKSRIEDVDFASETANFARANMLAQAGTAMLSKANQLPQMALQLLQGL